MVLGSPILLLKFWNFAIPHQNFQKYFEILDFSKLLWYFLNFLKCWIILKFWIFGPRAKIFKIFLNFWSKFQKFKIWQANFASCGKNPKIQNFMVKFWPPPLLPPSKPLPRWLQEQKFKISKFCIKFCPPPPPVQLAAGAKIQKFKIIPPNFDPHLSNHLAAWTKSQKKSIQID